MRVTSVDVTSATPSAIGRPHRTKYALTDFEITTVAQSDLSPRWPAARLGASDGWPCSALAPNQELSGPGYVWQATYWTETDFLDLNPRNLYRSRDGNVSGPVFISRRSY
jgi:hypothetical protein